jgi:hypothetical protein
MYESAKEADATEGDDKSAETPKDKKKSDKDGAVEGEVVDEK